MQPTAMGTASASHAASAGSTGTVRVVSDERGFESLRAAWNGLAASRPELSVFARHEWFEAAWQWRKESAELFVLVHEDAGRIKALLPLCRRSARDGGIRQRELVFLAVPDTQCCDMLVAPQDRASSLEALADALALRRRSWDVMRLGQLPPGSAASALVEALGTRGCAKRLASAPGNPFVTLEGRWDDYYEGRSRRLKKANNLAANRLRKAGSVTVDWYRPGTQDAARLDALLSEVVAVSAESWKASTGTTLDRPGPGAFFRRISARACEAGWLSIWILRLDGKPLATEYQLVMDGHVHALRSDFRMAFEDVSPGSHLSRTMLEALFAEGYRRYWMGPGNNDYKFRWAEDASPVEHATVYAPSLSGRALAGWELLLKPMARRLRDRLRFADEAAQARSNA